MEEQAGSEQLGLREKIAAIVTAIGQLDAKAAAGVPQLQKVIQSLSEAGKRFGKYYDPYAVMVLPDPGIRERTVRRKVKTAAKRPAKVKKAKRTARKR
jgi:hypothetical protein